MECRSFEVTLLSAKGLKLENKKKKKNERIYAVAYITGTHGGYTDNKGKTRSDKTGGSDPTWNSSMTKFAFFEQTAQQNYLTLVIKIKAKRFFFDKKVGETYVPIKGLLEGATAQGKPVQSVSYLLSGNDQGVVNFTYRVGEVYLQKPRPVAYSGGRGSQGTTNSSSGFGTGLIGGLMVADIASHAHAGGGCGGGGCGGGGCGGGGCGGGGCGGGGCGGGGCGGGCGG